MITGKQRSYLKSLANGIDPIVSIGKSELTDSVVNAVDEALNARELVKVKIQDGAECRPKEVCEELAGRLNAEFVQAIGKKFVLYRQARNPEKRKIVLPR